MIRRLEEKSGSVRPRAGSALVLVIVITVLLATVGVMFVMMARVGQSATSAIADNRELAGAVDVVVNRIHTILVDDLFGVSPDPTDDLHLLAPPTIAGDRPDYSEFDIVNEPWDAPFSNLPPFFGWGDDPWLASLEPVEDPCSPGDYYWPQISDIGHFLSVFGWVVPADIAVEPTDVNDLLFEGVLADADGDGVTDSRWLSLPVTSSRGRPIFAAVRIIDNCAMLNLNTAHTADPCSQGEHLSAVDYERFLRGDDRSFPNRNRIRTARNGTYDPCDPCNTQRYHNDVIMNIENPGTDYVLFDIGDELEIRNRYLLTSPVEARFERADVANYTLDAGGAEYAALHIPCTTSDFYEWKWRMDHRNFDDTSGGDPCDTWKYDRRHVCTFYSFDRNLRRRMYPLVDVTDGTVDPNRIDWRLENKPVFTPGLGVPVNINNDISSNTIQSRQNILHLLYAFRAYFLDIDSDTGYQAAARRSAQLVANMIDYIDDNNPTTEGPFFDSDSEPYDYGGQRNQYPTYINRDIIRELIIEVSTYYRDVFGIGNVIDIDIQTEYDFGLGIDDPDETVYGYERQPFISELYRYYDDKQVPPVEYFAVELCNPYDSEIDLDGWNIRIGSTDYPLDNNFEILPASPTSPGGLERLVITSDVSVLASGEIRSILGFGISPRVDGIVELQRRDPTDPCEYLTVDATRPEQTTYLLTGGNDTFVSKRDDTAWRFTDAGSYTTDPCDNTSTLGKKNGININSANGFQMPVANNNEPLATLHDFEMVLSIGSERIGDDPNAVTTKVGLADTEGDVRFDVTREPPLLEYICFMNRPAPFWNLPGRININTATMEVIRAAIPPHPDWDPDADSLAQYIVNERPFRKITDLLEVTDFVQMIGDDDPNTGDSSIDDDFEERDWILSRVANIFTVRSDVFTAYILVRIGHDGPQKRMIAIFDRSNVFSPADTPRLIALHPVPDPR